MAYRNFTSTKITHDLGLQLVSIEKMFDTSAIPFIQPSDWLLRCLTIASGMALNTEKAVCEQIVSPILSEIKVLNDKKIQLFSGEQLNVDAQRGLNGEVDFMFAKSWNVLEMEVPIFAITEAKISKINRGIPQAVAQMYGARLFNQQHDLITPIIFGAVTEGEKWKFLKLENQFIYIDNTTYFINELPKLLGILQYIVNLSI